MFSVLAITLEAQETSGPGLTADQSSNLYYQSGWVRGAFPADLSASDPSGVCLMQTTVNGRAISTYVDPSPDHTQWTQCHGSEIDANVDTTAFANGAGAITLTYAAANAAGAPSTATKSINVDNVTPAVSLSAPADTASTAGTQDVTATATAGPSGIAAISCSVDGGPVQTYPGATAQIPVVGIGAHQVACSARNNAVNVSGVAASSPTATLDLSIRQPTASAITFARIADALQMPHRDRGRQGGRPRAHRPPARQARPGARAGPTRSPARAQMSRPDRGPHRQGGAQAPRQTGAAPRQAGLCQAARVRRVLLPHAVNEPTRRVRHGRPTTVSGFLGLADGTALGGQTVDVYSAPDDNAPRFRLMGTVTTDAYGDWTARVPAGPSRLIEAVFPGNTTTEPATSSTVTLKVPAKIAVSISPRVLPWSKKITISGRLVGGYVPGDGVALRLRVPYPGGHFLQEPFRTNRHGEFRFQWTYGAGRGVDVLPVRGGHHRDRVGLPLGGLCQPGRLRHVRTGHTPAPSLAGPAVRCAERTCSVTNV